MTSRTTIGIVGSLIGMLAACGVPESALEGPPPSSLPLRDIGDVQEPPIANVPDNPAPSEPASNGTPAPPAGMTTPLVGMTTPPAPGEMVTTPPGPVATPPNSGATTPPATDAMTGATTPPATDAMTGATTPVGSEANGGAPAMEDVVDGATLLPCDVAQIVSDHCSTCHGATPKFNAPMALMNSSDFVATAPVSGSPANVASSVRINLSGAGQMPPVGTVDALEPAELATLTAWLDSGAPADANGCAVTEPGAKDDGKLDPRPAKPGALQGPYEGWDDGVTCYPFLTYDPASPDKSEPFKVGVAVDTYYGFGYKPPWEGIRYVRALRSITDNSEVLHHWILFEEEVADGSVTEIVGAHPAGAMMQGWAPGGTDLYFTPELGMKMDSNKGYLLEVHYNSSDANAVDASGVEICVTEEEPDNEVVVHWLGTDLINGTTSSGTCAPRASEPIHIIGANPHMHLKGKSMRVELNRQDGSTEMLHDEPFSFENQRSYSEDVVINPGDTIKTTCQYSSPATFGKGTNEEMCYWFALAYPAGALSDGGILGSLFHGPNSCLGL